MGSPGRTRTLQLHNDLGNEVVPLSVYLRDTGRTLTGATQVYGVSVRNIAVHEGLLSLELFGEKKLEPVPHAQRHRRQGEEEDEDEDVVRIDDDDESSDSDRVEVVQQGPVATLGTCVTNPVNSPLS